MQDGYSLESEPYSWTESVSKEELTLSRMEIAIRCNFPPQPYHFSWKGESENFKKKPFNLWHLLWLKLFLSAREDNFEQSKVKSVYQRS